MVRPDDSSSDQVCHPDVWELLPWYVNATLEGPELERVTARLSSCPSCRAELDRCRELAAAIRAQPEPAWTASPERLARGLARVHALERAKGQSGRESLFREIGRWLGLTPPRIRWVLAAEAALVVLLAVAVTWQATARLGSSYRTLAGETAGRSAEAGDLRVVFAASMTERELRELLMRIDARIVDGPSPMGVYTLRLSSAADAEERARVALETLRASSSVRLAERVGVGPAPSSRR